MGQSITIVADATQIEIGDNTQGVVLLPESSHRNLPLTFKLSADGNAWHRLCQVSVEAGHAAELPPGACAATYLKIIGANTPATICLK